MHVLTIPVAVRRMEELRDKKGIVPIEIENAAGLFESVEDQDCLDWFLCCGICSN